MKKDRKDYINAHQVVEDIINAIESEEKVADYDNVADFVNDPKHKSMFDERIEKGDMFDKTYQYLQSRDKSKDVERLVSHLDSIKTTRKLSIKRVLIVAAALIAVTFTVRVSHDLMKDHVTYIAYHSELPKNETPTLILSNGEKVSLSEIKEETKNVEFKKTGENKLKSITDSTASKEVKFNTIIVPAGYSYTVELSDGSLVTLNSGSKLTYPTRFDNKQRSVELSGEAFFEVSKSSIPFIVKSQSGNVKVYGTSFNLYAMPNHTFEAVLISGSIGFTPNNGNEMMITPGQMLSCDKVGNCNLKEVDTYEYTSWKDNNFIFVDQSLERVLVEISKWYDIEIGYKSNYNVTDVSLTLMLSRDTPLNVTLKTISEILNIKIVNEGRRQYIIE